MACTIILCILANSLLLLPYYLRKRTEAVRGAWKGVNTSLMRGEIASSAFDAELSKISTQYEIRLLILDGESQTVKSSAVDDTERMAVLLWNHILGHEDSYADVDVIEKTNTYTLQKENYRQSGTQYLILWGYLDNGNMCMIESPLDSIDVSAALSSRFMIAAGLFSAALGAILIFFITGRMTRPVTRLTALSEEMKKLNFEAKYSDRTGNELDLLGENLNELSSALEQTISELKTANTKLLRDIEKKEEIDAERRTFVSDVSHELKTPIALIQGYAEGLVEGVTDDEESRQEYCRVILDEAGKMNRLVKELLTLSHLESGENPMNFTRFDITELIRNYLRSAQLLIQKAGANVRMEDYPPVYVWADEFMVETVLQNYVGNALKHLDGEKILEVRMERREEETVRISVFNTGEPIPPESMGQIWDKFYKVDKARTRDDGGSGIGLSIVKAIMETLHRGYGVIDYDNGVEFWFELEATNADQ